MSFELHFKVGVMKENCLFCKVWELK